jgi:hypothetical protein
MIGNVYKMATIHFTVFTFHSVAYCSLPAHKRVLTGK